MSLRTTSLASVATALVLAFSASSASAQSLSAGISASGNVSAGVRIGLPQVNVQIGGPSVTVVRQAPPVVIRQAPPVYYAPAPVYVSPPPVYYAPAPVYYTRPGVAVEVGTPAERSWRDDNRPEWGLTGRLSGGGFGGRSYSSNDSYYSSDAAGLAGIGVGLRLRPIPHLAIEGNIDGYVGQDTFQRTRGEGALSVNLIAYANPHSVVQFYGLAGLGVGHSSAHSTYCDAVYYNDGRSGCNDGGEYNFVGAQLGVGLEFRVAKHFAFHGDIRGFVRSSDGDNGRPEFVAADGRATNTSGGAMGTLGATIYFR